MDCTAEPSELTALMGPSGAGKTTLLNIMRGTAEGKITAGEVLANGSPIDPHKLKLVSNLIPQDDVLFPSLTVRQQLHYAAQLRCSGTAEDRSNIVSELIARLSLTACADTLTGSTLVRGISGGQRKRLSIALELLTFPSVLFVDEPTSGLDSKTALDVMQVRSADLAPYRLWQHSQPRLPGSTPKRLVCRVAFAVRCAQSIAVQLLQELAHVEGIAVIAVIHQALICTALPSSSQLHPTDVSLGFDACPACAAVDGAGTRRLGLRRICPHRGCAHTFWGCFLAAVLQVLPAFRQTDPFGRRCRRPCAHTDEVLGKCQLGPTCPRATQSLQPDTALFASPALPSWRAAGHRRASPSIADAHAHHTDGSPSGVQGACASRGPWRRRCPSPRPLVCHVAAVARGPCRRIRLPANTDAVGHAGDPTGGTLRYAAGYSIAGLMENPADFLIDALQAKRKANAAKSSVREGPGGAGRGRAGARCSARRGRGRMTRTASRTRGQRRARPTCRTRSSPSRRSARSAEGVARLAGPSARQLQRVPARARTGPSARRVHSRRSLHRALVAARARRR